MSDRPACASCHQKPGSVDHSPRKMAGFDDPTILGGVIQNAVYPEKTGAARPRALMRPRAALLHGPQVEPPTREERHPHAHLRSLPLGKVGGPSRRQLEHAGHADRRRTKVKTPASPAAIIIGSPSRSRWAAAAETQNSGPRLWAPRAPGERGRWDCHPRAAATEGVRNLSGEGSGIARLP